MAALTLSLSKNVDQLSWASADTLTIINGATLTVNTTQTKYWKTITGTNGKLRIENTSTVTGLRFLMGRSSGSTVNAILPGSSLFSIEIAGNWIEIGTGDGTASQTKTSWCSDFVPAVWVETGSGTGVYEVWLNITGRAGEAERILREQFDAVGPGVRGRFFTQGVNPESGYVTTNPQSSHFTTTLTFGDGTNGAVIPNGAKVRMPNIMITDATPTNLLTTAHNLEAFISFTSGGNFTCDKALFDLATLSLLQASSVNITNTGITRQVAMSEVYNLTINNVGITTEPCRRVYVSSIWQSRLDSRFGYPTTWSYIAGTITDLAVHCHSPTTRVTSGSVTSATNHGVSFSYCANLVVTRLRITAACFQAASNGLGLFYVNDSTFIDTEVYGTGPLVAYYSNGNTFLGFNFSYDLVGGRTTSMVATHRFGRFADGTLLTAGTKAYFKTRTFRNGYDLSEFTTSREYSHTAMSDSVIEAGGGGGTHFPYYIGCTPGSASVVFTWVRREPTHNSPAYEIYRSTTPGFTARTATEKLYTTNTATTVTITDNGTLLLAAPVNGTTYYYRFRKYDSAGVYLESEEIRATPTAAVATVVNRCLQSHDFGTTWVKTNLTQTLNARNGPLEAVINNGALAATADQMAATGNATLVQTGITVSASTQYVFSIYLARPLTAGADGSVTIRLLTNTTATTADIVCNYTQRWQRFQGTITTGVGDTTLSVTIGHGTTWTNGEILILAAAQLELGATASPPVTTTTGVSSATQLAEEPTTIVSWERGLGLSIELAAVPAVPTGTVWWELYMSDTPGFTPSVNNLVGTTLPTVVTGSPFVLNTSNSNTVKNVTQIQKSSGPTQPFIALTSSSENRFINFDTDLNYKGSGSSYIFSLTTLANDNFFHNFDVGGFKDYLSGVTLLSLPNNVSGNTFQHIRSRNYALPINQALFGLNTILKGVAGADASVAVATSAATARPLIAGTNDGITVAQTSVYDSIFNELYTSPTTGALVILFNESQAASKPYVLTGTAQFSASGRLYLPAVGDSIEFTWPHKILGVSGFQNLLPLCSSAFAGTSAQIALAIYKEFKIAPGDTGVYGAYQEMTAANLAAASVSATTGFYLKIKLTARYSIMFDGQTTEFVAGESLNGQTSGVTAVLDAVEDGIPAGSAGTLALSSVVPFAATQVTGVSITFSAAARTIVRASGSFSTDNYKVGGWVTVTGTTNNNGTYQIITVAALTLTLDTAHSLTNETVTCTLNGATPFVDNENIRLAPSTVRAVVNSTGISPLSSILPWPGTYIDALRIETNVSQAVLYPEAVVDFNFNVIDTDGNTVTGYEWRLYVNDVTPGIIGTDELAGEETAASSSQTYTYEYSSDVDVSLQIMHPSFVEQVIAATLTSSDQTITVILTREENI